jgi:hypothetical protein
VLIPQPALQEEDSAFASEGMGSEDVSSSEPVSESDGMSDSGNPLTPDTAVRIVSFKFILKAIEMLSIVFTFACF